MVSACIALSRFGLGARSGESPPVNPQRWLLDQFDAFNPAPPALAHLPGSPAMVSALANIRMERQGLRQQRAEAEVASRAPKADAMAMAGAAPTARPQAAQAGLYRPLRQAYVEAVGAHTLNAAHSETPFVDRLVAFWTNHFAVSIDKLTVIGLAGPFEREAIRPNVLGKFADMLNAVERHPAMLLFLDQAQSIGPDSMLAERAAGRAQGNAKRGLNENLAREIMELHTLGVRSGYSQTDVTELARALTGWTVGGVGPLARRAQLDPGRFAFVPALHEPGRRTVLGRGYEQAGEAQAHAVLTDLAAHPATATHIATKLARHFAGDDPPPALVAKLDHAFQSSGGDLPTLYRVLIDAPETWTEVPGKFRPPWDWLVAVLRGTNLPMKAQPISFALTQLGQPMWKPGSPAGWDDIAASWAAPDALFRRVELAQRIAATAGPLDARALAVSWFGDSLSDATSQSVARAESPAQALALLLVAPEMLRR